MRKKFKGTMKNMCIVDQFLLVFMLVLLGYMVFHLFAGGDASQNAGTIDVIARTSAAAVFGYFISSNFVKGGSASETQNFQNTGLSSPTETTQTDEEQGRLRSQIGFQPSGGAKEKQAGKISFSENPPAFAGRCSRAQVIIVSSIGLLSLIILFVTRYAYSSAPGFTATVSQLRDFVSACIGFLISCGKNIND